MPHFMNDRAADSLRRGRAATIAILAALVLALAMQSGAAQAADACARAGGHGVWRFACKGQACTLQPTTVALMDQDGTHQESAFGLRLVIDPPSHIVVPTPPSATADLLQASATAGVIAEAVPDSETVFTFSEPDKVMALVEALQAGKRLLLVFVDTALSVNTAVAAIGHEGFAATLKDAFAAADAAAASEGAACPG
jgi:hypothetical protein